MLLLAYQIQAGYFVKQQQELGLKPRFIIGNTSLNHPEFFAAAGSAAEGVICSYLRIEESHPAAEAYRKRFHEDPKFSAGNGYDAVLIAARALRQCAPSPEAPCLKKALFAIKDFTGMSGSKSFDDVYGDMQDYYRLLTAAGGKFAPGADEKAGSESRG